MIFVIPGIHGLDFNRPEFGGNRIYADALISPLILNWIYRVKICGFGFAFIFYIGEYAADTAKYHRFVVTNTGQLYLLKQLLKSMMRTVCVLPCWKTFKKGYPKGIV